MEVRINKEVRNYQESLFFGLSLRQLLFALLAVAVAVGVYFGLRVYPLGIPVSPQARVQIGQHIRQSSGKFNDKGGSQT